MSAMHTSQLYATSAPHPLPLIPPKFFPKVRDPEPRHEKRPRLTSEPLTLVGHDPDDDVIDASEEVPASVFGSEELP